MIWRIFGKIGELRTVLHIQYHVLCSTLAICDKSINLTSISSDDWLEVYDGGNLSSPLIGSRMCGKEHADKILSSGNELLILFHSDDQCNIECTIGYKITVDLGKNFHIQIC